MKEKSRYRSGGTLPGLAFLMLAACAASHAGALPENVQRFDIPAQSTGDALNAFSRQSGIRLLFSYDAVEGRRTNAVSGDYRAEEVLGKLLAGTGLQYQVSADSVVLIGAAATGGVREEASSSSVLLALGDQSSSSQGESEDGEGKSPAGSAEPKNKASSREISEIVVTAQRRKENVQDVPISISVLSGRELDSSTGIGAMEALRNVPGTTTLIAMQGGGSQLTVRGVSASAPIFSGDSAISYYLDAVPFSLMGSAAVPDANVYDLDRIEVLRGPQGTLFGASALNGVVRVLTHDANLSQFEFKGRTSASSTKSGGENYRGDVAVNVPIIADKLALRAVVGYQDLSGWIDKPNSEDVNDARTTTARVKLNAQPTERLALGVSAWMSRSDNGAPDYSLASDAETSALPLDESLSTDYDIFGLTVGYDFGPVTLESSTSYIDYRNVGDLQQVTAASPGFPNGFVLTTELDSEVLTQEVYLNSAGEGPWKWLLGATYREAEQRTFQDFRAFTPIAPVDQGNRSKAHAVFGEVSYAFLDETLELAVGLRHFEDNKVARENVDFSLNNAVFAPGVPPDGLYRAEETYKKTTPRVTLTWHPAENLSTYASYAEGFRSGAQQQESVRVAAPDLPPQQPDSLSNYEVGAKGSVWDGRLTFESAVFYLLWRDIQLGLSVPYQGSFIGASINGDTASGFGAEFAVSAQLTDGLGAGVNLSWNDLTSDVDVINQASAGSLVLYEKGSRLNFSPEYTAGTFVDYEFPIGGAGYKGRLSASANYRTELYRRRIRGTAVEQLSGDKMLFGRASFAIDSPARWTASVFAENLGDEQGVYLAGNVLSTDLRPRPRTIGLQFEYRY